MDFAILGPLLVRANGHAIPITAPRQRALLAALLLQANQVVSVERLIDQLWGNAPPASARVTLHNHVRRLRRVLRDCPAETRSQLPAVQAQPIVTQTPGYVLQTEPEALDLSRFETLLATARSRASEEPEQALDLFDQAIALWRGAPLADVQAPGLREIVPALEEQRLSAIEERIQVRLDIGRYAAAISELRLLVSEHPWRERLRGQLMHALHAAGRIVEAQAAYQDFRQRVAADLGIEPSANLQQLHGRILTGEPPDGPRRGDRNRAVARLRRLPIPAELPMDSAAFTGRAEQARLLAAELGRTHAQHVGLTALHGPAGTGKSTLAVHVAHELATLFPDGQLYVDLRGTEANHAPQRPLDVLNRWIGALDPRPSRMFADRYEAAAYFRSLVAGRRLLVVLDNANDVDQVRPLIPARSPTAVVITSRQSMCTLDTVRMRLDRLDEGEAIELLIRLVGKERAVGAPSTAGRIVACCGYLPLAIRAAAARLAARPDESLDDLAEQLADERHRLDVLHQDDLDLRSRLRASYEQLRKQPGGQAAARLFRLLGVVGPAAFDLPDVAELAGVPVAQAARLLGLLRDAELVQRRPDGRCCLPVLVRLFARDL
ncbi:BTAD domain-containing putative transcriptional regulator [Polymorphospora sp. NPDC051019]|uniref:AfsR/SARP family transcriptional regulator n=1 Tax=Polymorphospora sp. NPDC051019 TaxID=3155725 RepID=UPI003447CF7C